MTKQARINKIIRPDGKALVAAFDHASVNGPMKGLINPGKTIESLIKGGADAVLTSYGTAVEFGNLLDHVGLIVRADGAFTSGGGDWRQDIELIYDVEDVLRIGGDALIAMGVTGKGESGVLSYLAHLGNKCTEWGVPLVAETFPFVNDNVSNKADDVAKAARVAIEYGADIIKTVYTGDAESFKTVVDCCYKPVFILGGSKSDNEEQVLTSVHDAMKAGAAGAIMGRNLYQHEHPERITRAVSAIIHENASVESAMKIIKGI
jgi:DhnA family fructose-bisphosphate aldolase class Ia